MSKHQTCLFLQKQQATTHPSTRSPAPPADKKAKTEKVKLRDGNELCIHVQSVYEE